jgi:phosphatidate cytidylyltransferase
MLWTRALVGSLLAALMIGVLVGDDYLAPWYPFLFGVVILIGLAGGHELSELIPAARRPNRYICVGGLVLIIVANWIRPLHDAAPRFIPWTDPWESIVGIIAAVVIGAFLVEMALYREPGEAVIRVALATFLVIYLGVLASFLVQLRWLPDVIGDSNRSRHALLLTIFVPKCCDIGAYCTGRLFGRHKMTPLLSSKKTWEGAAGGMVLAVLTAVGVSIFGQRPEFWIAKAVIFGITVGIAGMLGDLAESLIKREGQKKDASQAVPGFGGVLDVIDSVLFAAPVAYFWLTTAAIAPL